MKNQLKYHILKTKAGESIPETLLTLDTYDKETLQRVFDAEAKKLNEGDELEYLKEDKDFFYPSILHVEMIEGKLYTYNQKGYYKKYEPKY